MDIPNVGQAMALGELYDARTGLSTNISVLKKILPQTLIESRDETAINTKLTTSESYKEKFDILDVSGNLKVNILAGLVSVNAKGKYLTTEKTTSKLVKIAMSYALQTKLDRINIRSNMMRDYINTNALNSSMATHVVTGIQWGANVVCSFEHTLQEGESKEEVSDSLRGSVATVKVDVDGGSTLSKKSKESNKETSFEINVVGDVVPGREYPTTVDDAIMFLRNIPESVKATNEGKGSVVKYKLEPIGSVREHFGIQNKIEPVLSIIQADLITKVETICDTIIENRIRLNETLQDILDHKQYISATEVNRINKEIKFFRQDEEEFRSSLCKTVTAIQTGKAEEAPEKAFAKLFETFENGSCSSFVVDNVITSYQPLSRHISFRRYCKEVNIEVIPRGREIFDVLSMTDTTFILHIPESFDYTTVQKSNDWHIFNLLREDNKDEIFWIHEASISPTDPLSKDLTKLTIIKYYGTRRSDDQDVFRPSILRPSVQLSGTELISQDERTELEGNFLRMPCPLSHEGKCRRDAIKWTCCACEDFLEYKYDKVVYCRCGKTPLENCTFRCDSSAHGYQYKKLHAQSIPSIRAKMDSGDDEINILLLGETGVGKSTFINAFANYLQYPSLEIAESMPMKTLIQTSFEIEGRKVTVGEPDKNEKMTDGQSSTQSCRSYVFPLNDDFKIRWIDTPGIGDTRGVKQDRMNFEEIMNYISRYPKINGICILLAPNNSRLTTLFQFCIDELLLHLHKSAANNILFAFTKTRGTFYRVGDTKVPLETYLEKLKEERGITIPFQENTKFCFDNESFRLCAALKQGVVFDQRDKDDFGKSWTRSVEEAKRMVKRICDLTPHMTKDTVSLNMARGSILLLSPAMAHINEIITVQAKDIKDLKDKALKGEITADELEKKVMTTFMDLESVPLSYPRTVCSSESCMDIRNGNRIYKTYCHASCGINGPISEVRNDVRLKNCSAMSSGTCQVCLCPWFTHVHVRVHRRLVETKRPDAAHQRDFEVQLSKVKELKASIVKIDEQINAQRSEKEVIFKALVTFTSFLLQNSILYQNNAILEYIDMSISIQERAVQSSEEKDFSIVKSLRDQREEYKAQIEIFEKAIKDGVTDADEITVTDVINAKNALFKLKTYGPALLDAQKQGERSQTLSLHRETQITEVHNTGDWNL
ncbi:hypothetical protein BGZ65_005607, partial [Modicella reniformis]